MEKQLEKPMNFEQAASESLGLAYHLIPPESLHRLSRIFLEGIEKYPGKAVNAKNMNGAVGNTYWQVERFNHAVDHLLKWGQGDTSEDHLAKVMWFCSVMIEIERIASGLADAKTVTSCDMHSFARNPRTNHLDPVHRHTDGTWWFCDETWAHCDGPFPDRQTAEQKCFEYGQCLSQPKEQES